jgi:hypothetical protein
MNEQTMEFFAKLLQERTPQIGKSHLLVSMLHHILGKIGRLGHYLHIMDMLETAYFFGLNVKPIDTSNTRANVTVDPILK